MNPEFKLNRTPPDDDDSNPKTSFNTLLERFKAESLKKAKQQKQFKTPLRYTAVIAGVTVVCIISLSLLNNSKNINTGLSTQISGALSQPSKPKSELTSKRNTNRKRYTVNPNKGATLVHTDGTRIVIPKHAFVKSNQHSVDTAITFEFETYSGARDIMFSAIEMNCDSAGRKRCFESAGMFEIKACDSNVFINPKNPLEVSMPSNQISSKFRTYYSADRGLHWDLISERSAQTRSNATPVFNASVSAKPHEIETSNTPQKPKAPELWNAQSQYLKFQINSIDFPELKAFNALLFKPDPQYNASRSDWYSVSWANIKIEQGPDPGYNYKITLRYRNQTEILIAIPIYKDQDAQLAQARYAQALKEYESAVNLQEAKIKQNQKERISNQLKQQYDWNEAQKSKAKAVIEAQMDAKTKVMRTFFVKQFGVYNSDYPHEQTFNTSVIPQFYFSNTTINPDFAFAVDLKRRCVMQLNAGLKYRFAFDSESQYAFCVLLNNQIYWCTYNDAKPTLKAGNCIIPLSEVSKTELETFDQKFFM